MRARWMSRALVRCALLLLPPGAVRDRYDAEIRAELCGRPPLGQMRDAASFLRGAPALHRALVATGALDDPDSPTWCRVHLGHRWRVARTDDGETYRRCAACGTDDPTMVDIGLAERLMLGNSLHIY